MTRWVLLWLVEPLKPWAGSEVMTERRGGMWRSLLDVRRPREGGGVGRFSSWSGRVGRAAGGDGGPLDRSGRERRGDGDGGSHAIPLLPPQAV